ncbi:MAG: copper chaperone PCu(A)C [Sulfurospirillaceae bacterium]|nr:copper chaperone PCu(A)C [Sulfurospirillaceae bacterium]
MIKKIFLFSVIATSLIVAGNIEVKDAYVRAVPPSLPNSASFMKLINHSSDIIYLKRADSTLAKRLELHEHTMENGMMVMRKVPSIKIPAKSMVMLKPGGYHIMLIGLKKHLKNHDTVKKIDLYFSNGEKVILRNVPVKSVMGGMNMSKMKKN